MLPPLWNPPYNDEDIRHIAGFIEMVRRRVLTAIATLESGAADVAPKWRDAMLLYWQAGEQWTRWMLSDLGYPVRKGELWSDGEGTVDDGP